MNLQILKQKFDELKNIGDYKNDNLLILNETLDYNKSIIKNLEHVKNVSGIKKVKSALDELYKIIEVIEEENDLKEFNKTGKVFDFKRLKKDFYKRSLNEKFPKLDINKYVQYLENPMKKIENFKGEKIYFDDYWIKKNLIAINQMIFNEMDLYILNIGKEGSGKSCWSSQQILYFYAFFTEIGLIDYAYDIKKMFFIDINDFLENHETQKNDDYFKIECLDEGNQLSRQNFRDEDNKQFKYEMRTERKMLRVIMLNMQQIGELDTSISLSRVNFIYDCKMRSNKRMGMLDKGYIDMYIIPRGEEIYSNKYKKIITRNEILNDFSVKLDKKKDYYISLPTKTMVHNFKFEGVWGFDKDEYDDFVKDKMRNRRFKSKQKLTDEQAFILLEKFKNFKYFRVVSDDNIVDKSKAYKVLNNANKNEKKMYDTLSKFFKRIESYFDSNVEKHNALKHNYDTIKK